eukprot:SAG31_NODE_1833_length_7137_cov_2.587667_7_plen_82_part_00
MRYRSASFYLPALRDDTARRTSSMAGRLHRSCLDQKKLIHAQMLCPTVVLVNIVRRVVAVEMPSAQGGKPCRRTELSSQNF